MTLTVDQLIATNQSNVDAIRTMTSQAFEGFVKLVDLNLATSKATMIESLSHTQAVLGATDAEELLALQAALLQPLTEGAAAYGRDVYDIASSTGAELMKAIDVQFAEAQRAFTEAVDDAMKNSPTGSEAAVALFKSVVGTSQSAIESAQKTARQAVELAEANIAAVTTPGVNAGKTASRKT